MPYVTVDGMDGTQSEPRETGWGEVLCLMDSYVLTMGWLTR